MAGIKVLYSIRKSFKKGNYFFFTMANFIKYEKCKLCHKVKITSTHLLRNFFPFVEKFNKKAERERERERVINQY